MVSSFKYRTVSVLLAGIFTIFSVGIPIVLASCPMMLSSVRGSCCPENTTGNLPTVKSDNDYSCCKTIIVAYRNKTEFLQTQNDGTTQLLNFSTTPILYISNILASATISKIILTDTHSPPLIEDIPIFTSSLLI